MEILAQVEGRVDEGDRAALAAGLALADGTACLPAGLEPHPARHSDPSYKFLCRYPIITVVPPVWQEVFLIFLFILPKTAFVKGEDEMAASLCAMAVVAFNGAKTYYEEKHDKATFVKNIISDNILPRTGPGRCPPR